MIIYTDGLLEARTIENWPGYVCVDWLYPGESPFKMGRAMIRLDRKLKTEGFKGWMTWSQPENTNMHRHIQWMGAKEYARRDDKVFFKREVA